MRPFQSRPMIVSLFLTLSVPWAQEALQNPTLEMTGESPTGWRTKGLQALKPARTEAGLTLHFPGAPKQFLDWELGQKTTLSPGRYRLTLKIQGDPGTKFFAGLRSGTQSFGTDLWATGKGKDGEFSTSFHTGPSALEMNLLIGFGFKDNEGRSLTLKSISLTKVVPPVFPAIPLKGPVALSLKPKGAETPFRPQLLGHNIPSINWHGTEKSEPLFWDGNTSSTRKEWEELTRAFPLHLMRFHFGNDYPWKDAVGPLAGRKAIAHDLWEETYKTEAGIYEFLVWLEGLPGKPEASLILSPLRPVEEVADLVAFVRAKTGPMAEWRARCGHPAPFNVTTWELGNEVDWRGRGDLNVLRQETAEEKAKRKHFLVEEYIARLRPIIAAVKKVDPGARLYPHAATSPWFHLEPEKMNWHRAILKELGGGIAGLVVHPYYDGYAVPLTLTNLDLVRADMAALAPGRGLTLWLSEHARWVNYDKEEERPQSWGLGGALGTVDFLMQVFARPDVGAANYWTFVNRGPWRVVNDDLEDYGNQRFGTAIHHAYRLLNRAAGQQWQAMDANTERPIVHPNGYPYTVTAGTFSGGTRSLVAVNRSPDQGFWLPLPEALRKATTLTRLLVTGPSLKASPIAGAPDAVTFTEQDEKVISSPNGPAVLLPPRSLAAWILDP